MARSKRRRPKGGICWTYDNLHWYPPRFDNEAARNQLWLLFEREREHCFWCGRQVQMKVKAVADAASRDHIIPRSEGGSDDLNNLVLSCFRCNQERGNMPAQAFGKLMWGEPTS